MKYFWLWSISIVTGKKVSNHLQPLHANRPHTVPLVLPGVVCQHAGSTGCLGRPGSCTLWLLHIWEGRGKAVTRPVVTTPAHTLPVLLPTCLAFTWSCSKHNEHISLIMLTVKNIDCLCRCICFTAANDGCLRSPGCKYDHQCRCGPC